ncbi:MAG: flagellar biosynthesis protein FlhF [Gammaproteobacteria bacterium]|nr:flagellar biosynthesis protein FlhF [Gammaproteobacteria bacterium]
MKIKRYLDKDMRNVLRRVRKDQGPDAVILSNRRVEDGIEVIAAIDYDEALMRHALGVAPDVETNINGDALMKIAEDDTDMTVSKIEVVSSGLAAAPIPRLDDLAIPAGNDLAIREMRAEISSMHSLLETQLSGLVWKDGARRFPMRAQVLRNMARLGLAPDVANILVNRLEPMKDIKNLWSTPLAELAKLLPVVDTNVLQDGGTFALIGPTGVGKTTTIAKIAAHYAMQNWADDIALVSADSYRIGAKEHLAAFANIIGAKVYSASSFDELSATLHQLRNKKLVLIDTEGRSQRDRDLSSQLAAYGRNADRVRFFLTLSAGAQEAALDETVREFSRVPLEGCIVTKIDEAAQLGCVMSALIRHDLPAVFFSDGQRVPEDLHPAARKKLWLVNQAVDCIEASRVGIDDRIMAENYSQLSVANA